MKAGASPWLRRPVPGPMPTPGPSVAAAGGAAGQAVGQIPVAWALGCVLLAAGLALASGASSATWVLWVLLAPLLEESVFRAGLQDTLLRRSLPPWLANGCTALCFTASHVLLRGAAWASWAVLLPALALGAVYGRSRQLRGCVALHALMNAGWMVAQQLAPV